MTVTQDATSTRFIPQSGAEYTTFLSGQSIANPDLLWIGGQASGNSTDLIGSKNGTVSGPFAGPAFHQAVSGWSSLGILFHNGNDDGCFSTDSGLPDISTTSMMAFMWSTIPSVSGRGLLSFGTLIGSGGVAVCQGASAHTKFGTMDGVAATDIGTSLADGDAHGVLLQINKATSQMVLTTDLGQDVLSISGAAPNGKGLYVGNGDIVTGGAAVAAGHVWLYLAAWFGSNAEITTAKQSALVSLYMTGSAGGGGTKRIASSPITKSKLTNSPLSAIAAQRARQRAAFMEAAA